MPIVIKNPTRIESAGNKPKVIEEYVGHVNTKNSDVSIAHMKSPAGWIEPGQRPEFDEYTLVIRGKLQVKSENGIQEVKAGQAVLVSKGEWVQYSTPEEPGAEYVSVCLPAFSPDTVHRDE
jgi:mannose-6-phosphate isomerase-like protein (cupin superfamily)